MSVFDLHGRPYVSAKAADLDPAVVTEVLARHGCNVTDAAQDLGVPASDLRRLLWTNPKLQDEVFEVVEARIDKAEKNIHEALNSDDSRRRDAASFFTLRNSARARKRGWITSSSSTVDLNVTTNNLSQTITYRWRNENDPDPNPDETERLRQERWGDKPLIEVKPLTEK
jgi:hypothetical protein